MRIYPGAINPVNVVLLVPTTPTTVTTEQADVASFLKHHKEAFTITRMSQTYDSAGKPTRLIWNLVASEYGDWQPGAGETTSEEMGMKYKSEARIILPANSVMIANDRITRQDGTFMYVNYVRKYRSHYTAYLRFTQGAN